MRVGPSKPAVRGRLQTTASCDGKEPWWSALRKRRDLIPSGKVQEDERKRTADDASKSARRYNATPSLQPHYRTFITTTGCSAPVPRIGTLTLIGSTYLDFSLSIGATGSRVPHRSLVQAHAAFTPDAAWAAIRPPPRLVPG